MQGTWIREPQGDTSVIFVHGILSSGDACWRHANGTYWPALLTQEKDLASVGVYVFTYRTDIFSGNYHLGDAVDSLKEHFHLDRLWESKRLIFVCHSMGGIVVRQLLVVRQAEFIERKTEVGLFLVASPSLGSTYATLLSGFARILGHSQVQVLRFAQDNVWLNDLDTNFQNLKEAGKLSLTGKELIEDQAIVLHKFLRTQVVEPFSGARYFGEHYKVPHSDHSTIAKPENSAAIQHRLLCRFLLDMLQSSPAVPAATNDMAASHSPQAPVHPARGSRGPARITISRNRQTGKCHAIDVGRDEVTVEDNVQEGEDDTIMVRPETSLDRPTS
jgi:hypothetical protein